MNTETFQLAATDDVPRIGARELKNKGHFMIQTEDGNWHQAYIAWIVDDWFIICDDEAAWNPADLYHGRPAKFYTQPPHEEHPVLWGIACALTGAFAAFVALRLILEWIL